MPRDGAHNCALRWHLQQKWHHQSAGKKDENTTGCRATNLQVCPCPGAAPTYLCWSVAAEEMHQGMAVCFRNNHVRAVRSGSLGGCRCWLCLCCQQHLPDLRRSGAPWRVWCQALMNQPDHVLGQLQRGERGQAGAAGRRAAALRDKLDSARRPRFLLCRVGAGCCYCVPITHAWSMRRGRPAVNWKEPALSLAGCASWRARRHSPTPARKAPQERRQPDNRLCSRCIQAASVVHLPRTRLLTLAAGRQSRCQAIPTCMPGAAAAKADTSQFTDLEEGIHASHCAWAASRIDPALLPAAAATANHQLPVPAGLLLHLTLGAARRVISLLRDWLQGLMLLDLKPPRLESSSDAGFGWKVALRAYQAPGKALACLPLYPGVLEVGVLGRPRCCSQRFRGAMMTRAAVLAALALLLACSGCCLAASSSGVLPGPTRLLDCCRGCPGSLFAWMRAMSWECPSKGGRGSLDLPSNPWINQQNAQSRKAGTRPEAAQGAGLLPWCYRRLAGCCGQ